MYRTINYQYYLVLFFILLSFSCQRDNRITLTEQKSSYDLKSIMLVDSMKRLIVKPFMLLIQMNKQMKQ
jgi:hypothetical protein